MPDIKKEKRVFLIFSGGNDRAVLGFLRALLLCGEHPYIIARTKKDKIFKTHFKKYVIWTRPTNELSLDIFFECLSQARKVSKNEKLIILPSSEYFNNFLLENRIKIQELGCEIPLTNESIYKTLTNKQSASEFFSKFGVVSPKTVEFKNKLPIVAKPLLNVSSGQSLYPQIIETPCQLKCFIESFNKDEFFFQEYVKGESLYLCFFISKNGEEFIYSQSNLIQQSDGKSMLLVEPSDFHFSTTSARLLNGLRDIGFYGLGMIEIIRTNECDYFIEMNPRIWGPIQFCIDQKQIILQAFIGDALYQNSLIYKDSVAPIKKGRYFWFGGLLEVIFSGKKLKWYKNQKSTIVAVLSNIAYDVYLRKDSWQCFFSEISEIAKRRFYEFFKK